MGEKTLTYETADGPETMVVESLEYESELAVWRFETQTDGAVDIVRLPRERVYEIRQRRTDRPESDRDQYGHP